MAGTPTQVTPASRPFYGYGHPEILSSPPTTFFLYRFQLRHKALVLQSELEQQKAQAQEEERLAMVAKKAAEDELALKISR